MTARENKRPKEREKDKEYRRLTLTRADVFFPLSTDRAEVQSSPVRRQGGSEEYVSDVSPYQSVPSPFARQGASHRRLS